MLKFRLTMAVILLSAASLLHAQGQSEEARLRFLNTQVLQLYGQLQAADASQGASLRNNARSILEERFGVLQSLIQQDPKQALELAFDENLLQALANAFPQSAGNLESRGVWEAPIEYVILDDATLTRHRVDISMQSGQENLMIHFPEHEPSGMQCGDILRVEGVKAGEQVAAADGSVSGSVASAGCSTLGDQKTVVILIEFPDDPLVDGDQSVHLPSTVTQPIVNNIFFAPTGRSVDGYWRETSYGAASASGIVVGPFTLDRKYTCDEYYAMRQAAINAADAAVNFSGYTRLMLVFPNPGSCGWAGLGTLGCGTLSSADGSFSYSTSWLLANYMGAIDNGVKLSTHEGGHNLSLHHASTRAFTNSVTGLPETIGPVGTAGTLNEYGDLFNTMGSWNFGHYNAPHKVRLGWLNVGTGSTNSVRQVESNGTFSIQPFENLPGLAALKVRRGTGNNAWLWLEYRRPIGLYDSAINSQVHNGALVHYEDSTTGTHSHLLDMTPGSASGFNDPAKLLGTFIDSYSNVSFNVDSATSTALGVTVSYGPVPCVRANPTISISPSSQSGQAGASLNYTVNVTNNDSTGCDTDLDFSLSSALPSGWPLATFALGTLTISPGTSLSTTMTRPIPSAASPASYQINSIATRSSNSASATATANVIVAPITSVVTDKSTYAKRSTVKMTATVTAGGSPAPSASVLFTLIKPKGTTTKTIIANTSGIAIWSYKLSGKDPAGTYRVKAKSTYSGLPGDDSTEVTFVVQ